MGHNIPLWYASTFGLADFVKLPLFGIIQIVKRRLSSNYGGGSLKNIAKAFGITYIKCDTPNDKKYWH